MAQSSGSVPTHEIKTFFDLKMFDVANWVAHLNGENDPGGMPSHETLSVSPQGDWSFSLVIGHPPSLVRDHFSSPRVVANPSNMMKCADLHPKDHNTQIFTDALNEGWGAHSEQVSTKVCGQTGI